MKFETIKKVHEFSVSSIASTKGNNLVDASASLLNYVSELPEYKCKTIRAEKQKTNSNKKTISFKF